ncbi:MAG: hypothetical protein ACYCZN_08410 [Candidatus Dormibacteria bacterium]
MLVAAQGARDSAVEATKFSLERSREQLVETARQLAKPSAAPRGGLSGSAMTWPAGDPG